MGIEWRSATSRAEAGVRDEDEEGGTARHQRLHAAADHRARAELGDDRERVGERERGRREADEHVEANRSGAGRGSLSCPESLNERVAIPVRNARRCN